MFTTYVRTYVLLDWGGVYVFCGLWFIRVYILTVPPPSPFFFGYDFVCGHGYVRSLFLFSDKMGGLTTGWFGLVHR